MSGNVSFYNESVKTAVPPTPEIMGIGIVPDIKKCVTSELKSIGNPIYLVGKETENEMGGSEYFKAIGIDGGAVPKIDIKILKKCMKGILTAIDNGYIASCHDISEGGIGVCLSEMAIGGDVGALIDLKNIGKNLRYDIKVFSESNDRWIIELKKEKEVDFIKLLEKEKNPYVKIGEVKYKELIINDGKNKLINLKVGELRDIWKNTIWEIMG
jgi:phosphoribosylformylglycinamidine synthase